MAFRYETNTRTIEPYAVQPTRDSRANAATLVMLQDLDAAGIAVPRRDDAAFVAGIWTVSRELGRIGTRAREDAAGTFDPELLGGEILDTRLDGDDHEFDGEDGPGEVLSGQDKMLETQRNAWKTRRGGRPGAVNDPQPAPFGSASRANTAAGQRAIDPSTYAPRDIDEDPHVDPPMFRGMELNDPSSLGQDEGDVQSAADAMVARAKAAWLPQNRKKRGDGASASGAVATAEDADDGGQSLMVERTRLAGLQPLVRRGLPR